ncbi:MAG: ligase-associated DNA damage response endonuclease PdeM [Chitinophagia bacterium]|nr:ligase-associated DNA damage response endonuclease PdeM [Chitinophagia bacterium]
MTLTHNGEQFVLLPEKALYLPAERLLVIADVHLGKAAHFRRAGIAIPQNAQTSDYDRLQALLLQVAPLKVYFLGDLFHSEWNHDWHNFCALIEAFPHIAFTLLKGNHDIIDDTYFTRLRISVTDTITQGRLVYSHEPIDSLPEGYTNITGHVHPGFRLQGTGRQSVLLPCFYCTPALWIIPAFGGLTGLFSLPKRADSRIYLVTTERIIAWQP